MRLNQNIKIIGKKVVLVPYEAKHVAKYHQWMQSTELQELTASEPLSLEDEYNMQRSWREDDDKCTFLVLDREVYEKTNNEIQALVGDTNLFLREDDDEQHSIESRQVAEAEIMIAETSARAKIAIKNTKSIQMFEKMHFSEISRSEVFQEITFERPVDGNWLQWLNAQVQFNVAEYRS